MKVVFRTDASLQMGSGHVMRCLTLADALTAQGAQCEFIFRAQSGGLLDLTRQRGYKVNDLPSLVNKAASAIKIISNSTQAAGQKIAHAAWLGCEWQTDAAQTGEILLKLQPDWLVVDHYALDVRWETSLRPCYKKLMVIDDLADRAHDCDLLLDQNLGRQEKDYANLVPTSCQVLLGPRYALLRPEFAVLRTYSLQRRSQLQPLKQLLITMGGVDQDNVTCQVLQALKACALPANCRITVVMGLATPWLQNVRELAAQMRWPTEVVVNVSDMAQRMADCDLAIGAAGGTSWERCCLGVPTLLMVLADNQKPGAQALQMAHAVHLLGEGTDGAQRLSLAIDQLMNAQDISSMSQAASTLTDGLGCERVLQSMGAMHG
jgi:UDP-2,4-diacetamido-2,4,6-trideoxy-beta-L-altropyranose hydrolase